MGIPLHTQFASSVSDRYNNYNPYYEPEESLPETTTSSGFDILSASADVVEEPSLITEYLAKGFSDEFVSKYNRELTVAASTLSVLILFTIGVCIWCLLGIFRQDKDEDEEEVNGGVVPAKKGSSGDGEDQGTDESSCGLSDVSVGKGKQEKKNGTAGASGARVNGGGGGKGLISKIFSRHNGNGTRILAQHRNVITPDKNIPFIVPTIQLPAQPPDSCRKGDSSVICDEHHHPEPQPSTSREGPSSRSNQKQLLLAQQFFPQLENPESDSCPLIAFTLFYELATQILNVRLLEGRNFPDTLNHTVSVKIYPGRGGKQTTKEFRSRSPVYNVEFCYHVRKSSLQTKILKLRAVIPGNPKRVIGYVNVALKDLPGFDLPSGEVTEDLKTTQLWRRVELPSEIGDGVKLRVSLKWSPEPSPGFLTLKVIEAAGLHENRDCDYSSSYVKVTLQEQGRNIKTRKTQLVRWGSVPVFDDVFVLTIPRELLQQISFLLVVIARGRLGSKAVLGKISIGPVPFALAASSGGVVPTSTSSSSTSSSSMTSTGTEIWEDMVHQPDTEIVRWLHLLP